MRHTDPDLAVRRIRRRLRHPLVRAWHTLALRVTNWRAGA